MTVKTDKYIVRIFAAIAAAFFIGLVAGFIFHAVISMPPVWMEYIG